MNIFHYISLAAMILLVILILVQTRGASIGAGLGSSGDINITRRGTEKTIFQLTIVSALVFVSTLLLGIIIG